MEYRSLGTSGLTVSALAFGGWQIGDPGYWGADAEADGSRAVDAAIDAGINLFDSAEMYGAGESEKALGRALRGKRDKVIVATKIQPGNCLFEKVRPACEASLKRLGTDYIDLYQVHWPCRDTAFADTYAELDALRREGKIRHIGVSNFGPRDLDAWMACGNTVSNQLGYNLAFRAIEWEIIPACQRHGVGIIVYMPLLQGILSYRWKSADEAPELRRRTRHFSCTRSSVRHGEPGCEELLFGALAQLDAIASRLGCSMACLALAWTLAQPGVTSVLIGARNVAQLTQNIQAANLRLDSATLAQIDTITFPPKEYFGTNADMWCGREASRIR